jgi:hypothetical protein
VPRLIAWPSAPDSLCRMESLVEEVRLIFQRRGISYGALAADELIVHHGSADVVVSFSSSGGRSVISVSADVLSHCEIAPHEQLRALRSLNDRNRSLSFGKFLLNMEAGTIALRYELLADSLQDEELLNALASVARAADDHDDVLQAELGTGLRASDRSGRELAIQAF